MSRKLLPLLFLLVLLFLPLLATAAPQFPALLEPRWEDLPKADEPGIRRSWNAALELLASDLGLETGPRILEPGLDQELWPEGVLRVVFSGDEAPYIAIIQALDKEGDSVDQRLLRFSETGQGLSLKFARSLEALMVKRDGAAKDKPPHLLDAFSPGDLVGVDIPAPGPAYLYPYALAARKQGTLVAALLSVVLEFGPAWEVKGQVGKVLADEGSLGYAFGLSMSPSGTLILRNSDGTGTWSFPEGSTAYQRLRLEAPPGSAFGVLDDGSPFVLAYSPRIARVYAKDGPREIPLDQDSYIIAAAAGPENTLWLYDVQTASISILDSEAFFLRDLVFPDLPQGSTIMKLKVLPDSSFLAITGTDIRRFDRKGGLLWSGMAGPRACP